MSMVPVWFAKESALLFQPGTSGASLLLIAKIVASLCVCVFAPIFFNACHPNCPCRHQHRAWAPRQGCQTVPIAPHKQSSQRSLNTHWRSHLVNPRHLPHHRGSCGASSNQLTHKGPHPRASCPTSLCEALGHKNHHGAKQTVRKSKRVSSKRMGGKTLPAEIPQSSPTMRTFEASTTTNTTNTTNNSKKKTKKNQMSVLLHTRRGTSARQAL